MAPCLQTLRCLWLCRQICTVTTTWRYKEVGTESEILLISFWSTERVFPRAFSSLWVLMLFGICCFLSIKTPDSLHRHPRKRIFYNMTPLCKQHPLRTCWTSCHELDTALTPVIWRPVACFSSPDTTWTLTKHLRGLPTVHVCVVTSVVSLQE